MVLHPATSIRITLSWGDHWAEETLRRARFRASMQDHQRRSPCRACLCRRIRDLRGSPPPGSTSEALVPSQERSLGVRRYSHATETREISGARLSPLWAWPERNEEPCPGSHAKHNERPRHRMVIWLLGLLTMPGEPFRPQHRRGPAGPPYRRATGSPFAQSVAIVIPIPPGPGVSARFPGRSPCPAASSDSPHTPPPSPAPLPPAWPGP